MTNAHRTVLVLGATGRFGHAAIAAFAEAGWIVHAQVRPGKKPSCNRAAKTISLDIHDHDALAAAAKDCSVIVNALNPPYPQWALELPRMTKAVIAAAKASGATVMIPGNLYNYGSQMPNVLDRDTPHNADTRKGRLRIDMEAAYKAAAGAGVQTIILRIGDFLDSRSTGNWFDTHLTTKLGKGKFVYPGNPDAIHAWGYLPDAARAMVGLADQRESLSNFEDVPFEGLNLTGNQLREAIAKTMARDIAIASFPWWLIRIVSAFSPLMRETLEMRYIWNVPHAVESKRLREIVPDFQPTPKDKIMKDILSRYLPADASFTSDARRLEPAYQSPQVQ